jgi:hypothetical protein
MSNGSNGCVTCETGLTERDWTKMISVAYILHLL